LPGCGTAASAQRLLRLDPAMALLLMAGFDYAGVMVPGGNQSES
jgi:hypothetical protein